MTRGRQAALAVGAVVVLAAAVLVGRAVVSPPKHPAFTLHAASAPPYPPPGFVAFRDQAAGFSIAYPKSWTRLAPDPQVDLLATDGAGVSLLVRVTAVNLGTVTADNLPRVRRLTDRLVQADGRARQVRPPRKIVLSGVPGYLYLYTFRQVGTTQTKAHAHYFLFKDGALIALVFQVEPAESLVRLAPTLDAVARTFRATAK